MWQLNLVGRAGEEYLEWMHHRMELIIKKLTFRQGHLRQGAELHNVGCLPHVRKLRADHAAAREALKRGTYERHVEWAGPPRFDRPEVPALEEYVERHAGRGGVCRDRPEPAADEDEDEAGEGDTLHQDAEVRDALAAVIADGGMADDEPVSDADGEVGGAAAGAAAPLPGKRQRRQAVPWWDEPDLPSAGGAAGAAGVAGGAAGGAAGDGAGDDLWDLLDPDS